MDIFSWQHTSKIQLLIIVLVSLSLGYLSIHEGHDWGGDFTLYIDQAEAIKTGSLDQLYEQNKFTVDHSDIATLSPYLYPIGFPLLLAPFNTENPTYYNIKLYGLLIFGLLILVIYLFFNQISKNKISNLFVTICIGWHYGYFIQVDEILSDIAFAFFCFMAFLLISKNKRESLYNYILIGFLIGVAFLIRANGIFILAALACYQFLNRKEQIGIKSLSPYIIFAIIFLTDYFLNINYESNYENMFSVSNLAFLWSNSLYYAAHISKFPFGSFDELPLSISAIQLIITLIFCGLGFYKNWRRMLPFVVFVILNLALYLVWPSKQGLRFLFPIIPIIVGLFVMGIYCIPQLKVRYSLLALCFSLICFNSLDNLIEHRTISSNECYTEDAQDLYHHIIENSPREAIFNFIKPRVLRHFTSRNAVVQQTFNLNEPQVWKYLVTDTIYNDKADKLEVVYSNATFNVYQLKN